MSKISLSFYFKFGLVGIVLLSLFTGLADSDWYWQVRLGESIVKYGKFNDFSSLVWGNNLGYYLDHEWLSNVIFYALSLLPYSIIATKALLVSLCCISVYLYIKSYNRHNNACVIVLTLILLSVGSISVFKVKPYMFSFILLLSELYFLRYINRKTSVLGLVLVSVLWINLHGSYPLFICVFGLYIVCLVIRFIKKEITAKSVIFRAIKIFVLSILSSLINPFGFKLLFFNLMHNSDSTMKVLIEDWKAVDCKTSLGVLVFIVIILYILVLRYCSSFNLFSFTFAIAMLFMTLCSARHLLYFIVSLLFLVCTCDIKLRLPNKSVGILCYLTLVIGLSSSISLFSIKDYNKDYGFNYVEDFTISSIKMYYEKDNYKGLFLNSCFNTVLGSGVKTFTNGIYPLVSDRVKDELYITYYASSSDIKTIIDYYGLTGFVVDRYSIYEGYSRNSVLYQYLSDSSDYICIDDTDYYGFFVSKSLVDKND